MHKLGFKRKKDAIEVYGVFRESSNTLNPVSTNS